MTTGGQYDVYRAPRDFVDIKLGFWRQPEGGGADASKGIGYVDV
jgi:hypothetical protein